MFKGYIVEVRDCNGRRETLEFSNRSHFLEWCNEIYENEQYEDYQVMTIVQLVGSQSTPCVLYNGLTSTFGLNWEELIGFLS